MLYKGEDRDLQSRPGNCCKAFVRKIHMLCYSTSLGLREVTPDLITGPHLLIYGAEKPGEMNQSFFGGQVVTNIEELAEKRMILMSSCSRTGGWGGYFYCQW